MYLFVTVQKLSSSVPRLFRGDVKLKMLQPDC